MNTYRLWVNGSLVPLDASVIRADDHGLVVGDGVFETCEVRDGKVFALSRHLRRLGDSAAGLGLAFDTGQIRDAVAAVVHDGLVHARLRITLTGGPAPYGSARGDGPGTVIVATGPLHDWPELADVAVVPWTRNENAATAGLKTTSYADNVVALAWAKERGAAEAIFANTRGEVCEGTGSNLFYERDGVLVTPPLSAGCLGGITRELLLEWMRADGVTVEEVAEPMDRLRSAREAFLTSSTRAVQAIGTIDGRAYPDAPGPLTQQAAKLFADRAAEGNDP